MVLFDIFIYIVFAWIMVFFAKLSCVHNGSSKIDKYLWYYIAFFTIIGAIRWAVGVDSINYAEGFARGVSSQELLDSNGGKEYLNIFFAQTIHNLGLHFTVGLGLYAFLQILFIVLALKEHKYVLVALPVVLFGSHYFLDLMNGVRQMIVACGFLWASQFIVKRKALYYFGYVAIAYLMHSSALLLIPFYFIPKWFVISDKRWTCLSVYIICFILGMTPQFQSMTSYAVSLTSLFGYENYADRVSDFLTFGDTNVARALGPMQISYFLTGLLTIVFAPRLKEHYEDKIPCFNLWYTLSIFYICAYFLLCNISSIILRPILYLEVFHMVITSLLLYDIKQKAKYPILYIAVELIIWVSISWNIVKAHNLTSLDRRDFTTYKVFFMHMDEVEKIG